MGGKSVCISPQVFSMKIFFIKIFSMQIFSAIEAMHIMVVVVVKINIKNDVVKASSTKLLP